MSARSEAKRGWERQLVWRDVMREEQEWGKGLGTTVFFGLFYFFSVVILTRRSGDSGEKGRCKSKKIGLYSGRLASITDDDTPKSKISFSLKACFLPFDFTPDRPDPPVQPIPTGHPTKP